MSQTGLYKHNQPLHQHYRLCWRVLQSSWRWLPPETQEGPERLQDILKPLIFSPSRSVWLGSLIPSSLLFPFFWENLSSSQASSVVQVLVTVMLNYNQIYRNLLARAIFLSADKWICQAPRNNSVRLSSCSMKEKKNLNLSASDYIKWISNLTNKHQLSSSDIYARGASGFLDVNKITAAAWLNEILISVLQSISQASCN